MSKKASTQNVGRVLYMAGLAALSICLVVAIAACGSASSTEAVTGGDTVGSGDAGRTERATTAGEAAATAAGETTTVPTKTIGILQLNHTAEVCAIIQKGVEDSAAALGWKTIAIDAMGDPKQMAAAGDSLLNQKCDVIMSIAIEASAIKAQLERAKGMGVPWMTVGGAATPNDLFTAQYAPMETEMSVLIDKYLIDRITAEAPKPWTIGLASFSSVWAGKQRSDALRQDLEGTGITVVDEHQDDLANEHEDAKNWTETVLTSFPEISCIMGTADFNYPAQSEVIAARYPGKQFPERPLNVGYLDNQINLKQIREGKADALATMRLDAPCWVAMDQTAEYFARDKAYDPEAYLNSVDVYGLDFRDALLITKDNLPPEGEYAPSKEDFQTFFKTKWAKEFGTSQ